MTFTRRNSYSGQTIEEYIAREAEAIAHEAAEETHLSSIMYDGRERFGLAGEALVDFVQRTLVALVERGAKPAFLSSDHDYEWAVEHRYGESHDEIVKNVMAEWQAARRDPGNWSAADVCFIVPRGGPDGRFVKP